MPPCKEEKIPCLFWLEGKGLGVLDFCFVMIRGMNTSERKLLFEPVAS